MSSPEEPHRPVPPQPGHQPSAGQPAAGQPPVPYYAAPPGPPGYAAPPPANGAPANYPPPANGAPPNYPPPNSAPANYPPPANGAPANYPPPANGAPPNYPPPGAGAPANYPPPANGAPANYPPPANSAPHYGSPYYGGPGRPPPKKSHKALWIVLGIVGSVLLLVAVGGVILINVVGGATNQARGIADEFTKLIIAGDVNNAYENYLDPALKEKLSREEFALGVQGLGLDSSCKPNYSSVNVSSKNGSNSADIAGSIDCDTKRVELIYRFEGLHELKMVNIRLRPQR